MVSITNTELKFNEAKAMPTNTAVDSDGAKISFAAADDSRILIILENSAEAAKTATVKAGNSIQGISDLTVSLTAGATKVITVESGKYKNVSGTYAGYVVVTGESTDIKVSAVVLP